MKTWIVTLAILTLTWASARADIPPPPGATRAEIEEWQRARAANERARLEALHSLPPLPAAKVVPLGKVLPFVVNGTGGTGELRIVLPAKLVQELQAAQTGNSGFPLPGPEQIPTLIAGLALSLALVTGGLWLLRSRRRLAFGTLAFILATTTVLGIGCIHTKDKTTPDQQVPTALVQTLDGILVGQAVLASSDKDEVQVTVDREAMGRYIPAAGIRTEIIDTRKTPPTGEIK